MSNQQLNVPALLIEQLGTGADTIGIIGKRIRVTNGVLKDHPLRFFLGIAPYDGAEGTVIHVSEDGSIFADFGGDEDIPLVGEGDESAVRVHAIGNVHQDPEDYYFEVIGG